MFKPMRRYISPMPWVHEYPYLATSVAMLLLACLGLWLRPLQAKYALLSGLLGVPYALFSFEFVGSYWHPRTIAFWWITSPEDLLFSFSAGVTAWLLATWPFGDNLRCTPSWNLLLRRYLGLSALGIGIGYAIKFTHPIGVMNSAMVGVVVVGGLLCWLKRDGLRISLAGMLGFGLYYLVLGAASIGLWPHFAEQWRSAELLSFNIFGLPSYELIWALGYGAVWPLFMAYIYSATFTPTEGGQMGDLELDPVRAECD